MNFLSVYYTYEKQGIDTAAPIPGLEPLKLLDIPYLILMKIQAGGAKDKSDIIELYRIAAQEQKMKIIDVAKHFHKWEELNRLLASSNIDAEEGGEEDGR